VKKKPSVRLDDMTLKKVDDCIIKVTVTTRHAEWSNLGDDGIEFFASMNGDSIPTTIAYLGEEDLYGVCSASFLSRGPYGVQSICSHPTILPPGSAWLQKVLACVGRSLPEAQPPTQHRAETQAIQSRLNFLTCAAVRYSKELLDSVLRILEAPQSNKGSMANQSHSAVASPSRGWLKKGGRGISLPAATINIAETAPPPQGSCILVPGKNLQRDPQEWGAIQGIVCKNSQTKGWVELKQATDSESDIKSWFPSGTPIPPDPPVSSRKKAASKGMRNWPVVGKEPEEERVKKPAKQKVQPKKQKAKPKKGKSSQPT
jgi:hypothetical protein